MSSANASYLIADRQGSIAGTANASGALTANYAYDPYGTPSAWGTIGSAPRFRYTGQIAIPEAQLYYYKARLYDPAFAKFLQTDPVGDDLNLYAYVGGDPVNENDPSGDTACGGSDAVQCYAGPMNGVQVQGRDSKTGQGQGADGGQSSSSGDARTPQAGKTCGWACTNDQARNVISQRVFSAKYGAYFLAPVLAPDAVVGLVELIPSAASLLRSTISSANAGDGISVGTSFGNLGTVVAKPDLSVTGINDYAAARAAQRGMTLSSMNRVVSSPSVVLRQSSGNHLFLSGRGAVVLNQSGRVVTTYSPAQFDAVIRAIVTASTNGR